MSEPGTDQRTAAREAQEGELLSPAARDRLNRPPRRPARRSRLLPALAWCVTLGLLVVAVLRMLCHDATVPITWLNAFTLYLYLPAYLALAFAARTGRWWLATASAAVVACHLTWGLPGFP